jgi:hypothetical protein
MMKVDQLVGVVEDLVHILRLQNRELEKLLVQMEQTATHPASDNQINLVASELSELQDRLRRLRNAQVVYSE